MTKLHFEDLTQITCPFGLLDDDTQERLMAHRKVEYYAVDGWFDHEDRNGKWLGNYTFRAKPKPQRLETWMRLNKAGISLTTRKSVVARWHENKAGYIYRIERDEDGSNATIELVKTGGNDE